MKMKIPLLGCVAMACAATAFAQTPPTSSTQSTAPTSANQTITLSGCVSPGASASDPLMLSNVTIVTANPTQSPTSSTGTAGAAGTAGTAGTTGTATATGTSGTAGTTGTATGTTGTVTGTAGTPPVFICPVLWPPIYSR